VTKLISNRAVSACNEAQYWFWYSGYVLVSCLTVGGILHIQLSPPKPTSTPLSVGICVHSLSQTDAQLVGDSGAGWIRIDCNDTFGDFKNSVQNVKAYNFSVLAILDSWMFDQNCAFTLYEWRDNITYYVSNYADYVDAWEIWNEPTSTIPGWQIQVDYLPWYKSPLQSYANMTQPPQLSSSGITTLHRRSTHSTPTRRRQGICTKPLNTKHRRIWRCNLPTCLTHGAKNSPMQ
jgi:hypothetical protein